MTQFRIVYRQAWRADTGQDVSPDPTLVEADYFETTDYGVTFYRIDPDRRRDEPIVVMWVPIDLIRFVRRDPEEERPSWAGQ